MARCALVVVLAASCASALAHDTWLAAEQRTVQARSPLRLGMTSGEHFPVPGSSIDRDRIAHAGCQQGPAKFPLEPGRRGAKELHLEAKPPAQGAATCWVRLKPRTLDLTPDLVALYLEEIDATADIRKSWADMPAPKRWNETYTKNAKVIVPAGSSPPAIAGAAPTLTLELQPEADLSVGKLAGPLAVRVLRDGLPLAGLSVALVSEAGGTPQRQRSDAQGRVVFATQAPGRWMLSGTALRSLSAKEGTWESQFTTLVFELLP
jgi:uncharacterized GH25 family protein